MSDNKERPSFDLSVIDKKIVGIASQSAFSSGFLALIDNKAFVVVVKHGIADIGRCQVLCSKKFIPSQPIFLAKDDLDLGLIPLSDQEAQGREFFKLRRLTETDFYTCIGRTVRQVGARQTGRCGVVSGALNYVDDDVYEIAAHTESGDSGSVALVDDLVLGIHVGSRPLKVSPITVTDANRDLMETKIKDATLEQLSLAHSTRLIHLAKYGGSRGEGISVNKIFEAYEAWVQEAKGTKALVATCAQCGLPRSEQKFCGSCGAKY